MLSKTVFILCLLLLGLHLRADDKIAVTIAPETSTKKVFDGTYFATIDYNRDFHVIISNKTSVPVQLWRTWCSWGYYNLAFDIKLDNGKTYHLEKRKDMAWYKNYPDYYIVPPDSYFVIPVNFSKELGGASKEWNSFPDEVKSGDAVLLKALYSIPEDKETKEYKVWTGRGESEWLRVTFFR